jgi:hypothetical protein
MWLRICSQGEAMTKHIDYSLLEMALAGYRVEVERIKTAMAAIRKRLEKSASAPFTPDRARPKPVLSASARKRIAAAQKKRWSAFRKRKTESATKTAPKRKLSAAAKAKLIENLAKARDAKAAKKTESKP